MPQLDVVSFFNQIVWLTVVFILLVTSFYAFLLRPYNRLFMIRNVLSSIFTSLKTSNSEISSGSQASSVLRWYSSSIADVSPLSGSSDIRPFFIKAVKKIASIRKNVCILMAAAISFK